MILWWCKEKIHTKNIQNTSITSITSVVSRDHIARLCLFSAMEEAVPEFLQKAKLISQGAEAVSQHFRYTLLELFSECISLMVDF